MGEFLNHLAKFTGESMRIRKTAKEEQNNNSSAQQQVNFLLQKAQNGNVEAMFRLGNMYFKGDNVRYDPDTACYWWTEAANRGDNRSQYNLGLLYHGDISTMFYDANLAGYWLNMAANNGHEEAYKVLRYYYRYSNFSKKWKRIK